MTPDQVDQLVWDLSSSRLTRDPGARLIPHQSKVNRLLKKLGLEKPKPAPRPIPKWSWE